MKHIELFVTLTSLLCLAHGAAIPVNPVETSKEEPTDTQPKDDGDPSMNANTVDGPEVEPKEQVYAEPKSADTFRQARILDYFGYYGQPYIPAPILIPAPFMPFDYQPYEEEEPEELMSRANHRRRPSSATSSYQNSPIFYIRLPPTPYMFVPGMGYVSQPPTFNPLPGLPPIRPQLPTVAVSPLINLPINFVSNGRPTSVYQFNSDPRPQYYQPSHYYPSGRPHRPYYGSKPHYPDSKITNLKGTFNFNGRPESIYVLPNSIDPVYSNRVTPYY